MMAGKGKTAPVQGWGERIPWHMHLRAYEAYCKKWGPQEAMITGECRGGFHVDELDEFIPGWRDELKMAGVDDLEAKQDDG